MKKHRTITLTKQKLHYRGACPRGAAKYDGIKISTDPDDNLRLIDTEDGAQWNDIKWLAHALHINGLDMTCYYVHDGLYMRYEDPTLHAQVLAMCADVLAG